MFGSRPQVVIPPTPAAPDVLPPPRMPDPNSPSALDAQRRTLAAGALGGRQATILTTMADRKAGGSAAPRPAAAGTAFTSKTLGAG